MQPRTCLYSAALLGLLAGGALAADLAVGDAEGIPLGITSVPVTIANTADAISMVVFEVTPDPQLGVPTAVPGPDQPNLQPEDVFIDPLGGGVYRVTAFVLGAPDIGDGHLLSLEFNTTGLPTETFFVPAAAGELLTIGNVDVTGALDGGSITINASISENDWTMLE